MNSFGRFHPIALGSLCPLFVGRVSLIEIVAILWLVLYGRIGKLQILFSQVYSRLGLIYVSAFALFISDLYNQSDFQDLVKGVGAYVLFPTTVLFLVSSFNFRQLWILNLSYLVTSLLLRQPLISEGFSQDTFKFGFSMISTFALLTVSAVVVSRSKFLNQSLLVPLIISVVISVLGLWGNLRLLAFVSVIAFFLLCLKLIKIESSRRSKNVSFHIILAIAFAFPLLLVGISLLVSSLAPPLISLLLQDVINPDALQKTIQQISGDFGLLFSGRAEIFSSYLAWLDKPLLGWGSWAIDPHNFYDLAGKNLMLQHNYTFDLDRYESYVELAGQGWLIPTHSVLLNLLVWSGLTGFIPTYIFFVYYIVAIYSSIKSSIYLSSPILYNLIFASTLCIWNILFSPFGYSNRLSLSIVMAISLSWITDVQTRKNTFNSQNGNTLTLIDHRP
jgi:hypothetical protein